jgi:carbon-monoxide dehydrogenase medium subunit
MRVRKGEALLERQMLTEELAERAGEEAARECKPISDVRSSAEYRKAMVKAMTKRALLNTAADRPSISWIERREKRY